MAGADRTDLVSVMIFESAKPGSKPSGEEPGPLPQLLPWRSPLCIEVTVSATCPTLVSGGRASMLPSTGYGQVGFAQRE
jgi:hypothetical protein